MQIETNAELRHPGARQEAACVRSNRISPWSRSGDLDVAELGLLNIAVHSTTALLANVATVALIGRAGGCSVAAFYLLSAGPLGMADTLCRIWLTGARVGLIVQLRVLILVACVQ
jgi:hypothetical protein